MRPRTRGGTARAGLIAVGLALVTVAPTSAQDAPRSVTQGFHLAGSLNGAAIEYEGDGEVESGPGLALQIGYGISRAVTLYLAASGASVETYDGRDSYGLAHVDLGLRAHFGGPQRSVLGYVTAALNGRAASIDIAGDPFDISGTGLTLGGGLLVFLSRSAALDFGLRWTGGSFSDAEYRGNSTSIDVSASSARFDVGIAWWAG